MKMQLLESHMYSVFFFFFLVLFFLREGGLVKKNIYTASGGSEKSYVTFKVSVPAGKVVQSGINHVLNIGLVDTFRPTLP